MSLRCRALIAEIYGWLKTVGGFANSPDRKTELMNAIMGALEAHTALSTQALGSETVREGLKDVSLGPAQLYESLRKEP